MKILYAARMLRGAFVALFDRSAPVPYVPPRLWRRYTMGGKAVLRYHYLHNATPAAEPIVYTAARVDGFLKGVAERRQFYYGQMDEWLYQALDEFGIKGKSVAVFGSENPAYESVCLFYGGKPVTIEYRKIVTEDLRLKVMTPEEYGRSPVRFDAAFSISSFEHDGLGRYGDPLNPEGDLIAMEKTKQAVKPGGILYLSVPVGRDALVWNANRVYGKIRLPLLLKGWEVVKSFGFDEEMLTRKCGLQPVFVLKNPS